MNSEVYPSPPLQSGCLAALYVMSMKSWWLLDNILKEVMILVAHEAVVFNLVVMYLLILMFCCESCCFIIMLRGGEFLPATPLAGRN